MRKNLLKLIAIILTIGFSAFTGKAKLFAEETTHCFKFIGDPTNAAQVLNLNNYAEASFTCNGPEEIACAICTTDEYTHFSILLEQEVLNTPGNTPAGESVLSLNTSLGYLDTAPNPDVQYYKLSSGTGYTPFNKQH